MSKSMWIPTEGDNLPVTSEKIKFSIDVLFWREGEMQPTWGYYNYGNNCWVDGQDRQIYNESNVKYFAYIDNPYK